MYDYNTVARVTVTLPRTLTGMEVMAAVEAVIERKEDRYKPTYVQEKHYIDGNVYRVGQTSEYPYEHLLIAPKDSAEDFIFPNEQYTQLTVKNHGWSGSTYAVDYTEDSVIKAVRTFAEELLQQVSQY